MILTRVRYWTRLQERQARVVQVAVVCILAARRPMHARESLSAARTSHSRGTLCNTDRRSTAPLTTRARQTGPRHAPEKMSSAKVLRRPHQCLARRRGHSRHPWPSASCTRPLSEPAESACSGNSSVSGGAPSGSSGLQRHTRAAAGGTRALRTARRRTSLKTGRGAARCAARHARQGTGRC